MHRHTHMHIYALDTGWLHIFHVRDSDRSLGMSYSEEEFYFPQSLQHNAGIVLRLHDCVPLCLFKTHPTI